MEAFSPRWAVAGGGLGEINRHQNHARPVASVSFESKTPRMNSRDHRELGFWKQRCDFWKGRSRGER